MSFAFAVKIAQTEGTDCSEALLILNTFVHLSFHLISLLINREREIAISIFLNVNCFLSFSLFVSPTYTEKHIYMYISIGKEEVYRQVRNRYWLVFLAVQVVRAFRISISFYYLSLSILSVSTYVI